MKDRTAIDTIKGYFYQFDYTIKRLLELNSETDSIVVEGVEDVDIEAATEETAVQCKYYSKTEYNHSVIARPVRQMLSHYKTVKEGKNKRVKYLLYGHFKSGQQKLKAPINKDFLKDHLLTYTKENIQYYHHMILGLDDHDLTDFLSLLEININASSYENQLTDVLSLLKQQFNCSDFESENFYYNCALKNIKNIATEPNISKRKITKKQFLDLINTRKILFNLWFIEYKGKQKYLKGLKQQYFTNLNTSPFERFFLIEIPSSGYTRTELKELLFIISKKYSKLSKRESTPFCPYVYLHNIGRDELVKIKTELSQENFLFIDGYDFEGSTFNPTSISRNVTYENKIQLKILNEIDHIDRTLKEITKTKEIYQFYTADTFFNKYYQNIKHIEIQVSELKDIREVI